MRDEDKQEVLDVIFENAAIWTDAQLGVFARRAVCEDIGLEDEITRGEF